MACILLWSSAVRVHDIFFNIHRISNFTIHCFTVLNIQETVHKAQEIHIFNIHRPTDLVVYKQVDAILGIVEGRNSLKEFPDEGSGLFQEEPNHHCGVVVRLQIEGHQQ